MRRPAVTLASYCAAVVLLHTVFAAPPFHAIIFAVPILWARLVLTLPAEARRRIMRFSIPFALVGLTVSITALHLSMARAASSEFDLRQVPLAVWAMASLGMTFDAATRLSYRLLSARLPSRIVSAGIVATMLVVVAVPTTFCFVNSHRLRLHRVPVHVSTRVSFEEVSFETFDGLVLRGTLLRHREPRPGVVFCHGVSSNRGDFMPHAEEIAELGYSVLIYDARCHGQSEGRRISFGYWESRDASAAATWLLSRRDAVSGERVVLAGTSMGAATAILAGCADPRVAGVISEASFASLRDMAMTRFSALPRFAARALVKMVSWSAFLQLGVSLEDVDPERALAGLDRELPVLLMHGEDDGTIPLEHARRLHCAGRSTQLEIFERIGHSQCLGRQPGRYRRLVGEFLARHLP